MKVQLVIRKAAHLTEYALLSILLFRAVRSGVRWTFPHQALLVLGIGAVYAMTDEFHQTFNPSRTATIHDVVIDCCGVTIGLALYWAVRRGRDCPAALAVG